MPRGGIASPKAG